MKLVLGMAAAIVVLIFAVEMYAQKKPTISRVCGDPSAACSKRAIFDNDDIPFEYVEGSVVAETVPFYAVILKSVKIPDTAPCEKVPDGFETKQIQWNFLKNKVFIARSCYSIENNYYTNIGSNVIALAIYAGSTKAAADAFLKKVKTMDNFDAKDAYVLKIATGFNGT